MTTLRVEVPRKFRGFLAPHRYKIAYGGRGCLAKGTGVIMADGRIMAIEYVRPGDLMMGPDSKPRRVLSLHRGTEMMYRVKQTSADDYIVNGAHVLVLKKNKSCANDKGGLMPSGNFRRPRGRYADWPDEVEITVEDWLKQSKRWRENFRGFRAGCLQFEKRIVHVDPYLLGLWLGDGLHRELMITSADDEILDWLKAFAEINGLRFSTSKKYGANNSAVDARISRVKGEHGKFNPVWEGFKKYDLVCNKHIPNDYFVNDEETRLRLLAGLIDSDGTYSASNYDISLANESLARQVKRLADGLGFRTSIREKKTSCQNGFSGKAWRVTIGGDIDKVPCLLPRKKATIKANKDKTLSMISIDEVGVDDYYGVELDGDKRFLLADGTVTHNSGKSWTIADLLVLMAYQRPLRILCARELQLSIGESVHKLIADTIERRGLSAFFTVEKATIYGPNGSQFLFAGIKNNVTKIKSMEGVDICWVEEAEAVTAHSWNVLIPTIRKPGSEIWASFNPGNVLDETYQRFVVNAPADAHVVKVNWSDNPWFPEVLRREMEAMRETDPELARHIWDGEPVADSALAIIKPEWISAAVGALVKLGIEPSGGKLAGFDVADEGADANALIARYGVSVFHAEEWKDRDPNSAARYVFTQALRMALDTVRYDNIGVGAGAKGAIREELERLDRKAKPPEFEGFNAAAAVVNPALEYMPGKTNKDMFANAKAQAWWLLGDRFRETFNAVNGRPYDAEKLISLDPALPHLDKLCAELSQPRREFLNGKFKVESKKDMAARGVKSPNLADALVMAFAPESGFYDISALL